MCCIFNHPPLVGERLYRNRPDGIVESSQCNYHANHSQCKRRARTKGGFFNLIRVGILPVKTAGGANVTAPPKGNDHFYRLPPLHPQKPPSPQNQPTTFFVDTAAFNAA